jgi:hypothetical protein
LSKLKWNFEVVLLLLQDDFIGRTGNSKVFQCMMQGANYGESSSGTLVHRGTISACGLRLRDSTCVVHDVRARPKGDERASLDPRAMSASRGV